MRATKVPPTWPRVVGALRALVDRYLLSTLVVISVLLLVVAKADMQIVGYVSDNAGDAVRSVLEVLKQPVSGVRETADELGRILALRDENERLRADNERLMRWQTEAVRLAVQNRALRQVMRMPIKEEAPLAITARLVADSGGSFIHTRLIDAGSGAGVRSGMAVVNERGLVGRVIGVGQRSARVLLLTDFNSKIPVVVESSRDQAILEGTNTARPELRFLPLSPSFKQGDRVLTSGQGGLLPPGLLVGTISKIGDQGVVVTPFVDWERLDYVGALDYRPVEPPEAVPSEQPPVVSMDVVGQLAARAAR